MDSRVDAVVDLMEGGLSGQELLDRVKEEFRLNLFGADSLIKEAREEILRRRSDVLSSDEKVSIKTLDDHLAERQGLLEQAKQRGNLDAAIKIAKDMATLQNSYKEKVDRELIIEFQFPELAGYKPLDRSMLEAALKTGYTKSKKAGGGDGDGREEAKGRRGEGEEGGEV